MPTHRRRLVALLAASLVWSSLALGTATPAPAADPAPAPPSRAAARDLDTYYAGTDGLTGATLAARLNEIIRGHTRLTYAQVYDALPLTDADPARPGYLVDFYSGTSVLASNRCSSSCPSDSWNREHTWAQSHGDLTTSAGPGTDMHHMRPEFASTNSSRGNLDFDNGGTATVPLCALCKRDGDSFEPRDAVKGDLARGLMYMAVRYEGDSQFSRNLKLNDRTCNGSGAPNHGKLSTLVAWSLADPPDARERARNEMIDADYQHNRNPFVDHPEWVTAIFGDGVGAGPACGSTSGSEYLPGGTAPTNRPPTTAPMTATTAQDTTVTVDLVATDPDGDPLTWAVTTTPARGTAAVSGRTLTYRPAPGQTGDDTVGVTVSDGRGGSATTTVTITVTRVNRAPSAAPLSVATDRDRPVTLTLAGTDPDGDALTYAVATAPAHGAVAVSGASATYTPGPGYAGPDAFTYTARDPSGATSAPATVSLTVTATNRAPVASARTTTTREDTPVTFTLEATDPDGDPLTYAVTSTPRLGSVTLDGARATYTPRADAHGTDSFTWTVSDGVHVVTAEATVVVTPVDDPPVATPVEVTTPEDTAITFTLPASDVDGDPLTYAVTRAPQLGRVTLDGARATYTPRPDVHGTDTFTWSVSDGTTTVEATATVRITPVNDAPVPDAGSLTVRQGGSGQVTLSATDVDGDELTFALADPPRHGRVVLDGTRATYTADADAPTTDSFAWTVSDGTATATGRTTVTIRPNRAPTASSLEVATTDVDAVRIDLAGADADGDDLTYAVQQPSSGSVTVEGATATYTPDPAQVGTSYVAQLTYTASDGLLTSIPARVRVRVTAVNRPPTATDTRVGTTAGTPVTVGLAGLGAGDPDGDAVTIVSATPPASGAVQVTATAVTYVPSIRSGADAFVVTLADARGATTTARADVDVAAREVRLVLSAPAATRGTRTTLTVVATGPAGERPTGTVVVSAGSATVGSAVLGADGRARLPLVPTSAGTARLVATYAGDDLHGAATSAPAGLVVARTPARPAVSAVGTLRRGRAGTVRVAVPTVAGTAATGTVVVTVAGRRFTAPLARGVATVRVPRLPRAAGVAVTARYAGDRQYAPATVTRRLALRR